MQENRTWARWAEGAALIAGAVLALSPIWVSVSGAGIATMIVLGALIFLTGLFAATITPGKLVGGWFNLILGVLSFIAPLVIGYNTAVGASWTSWVVGAVAFVVGLIGLAGLAPAAGVSRRGTLAHGTR